MFKKIASRAVEYSSNTLPRLFIPSLEGMPKRRYDLDWLRVLVFGLLILFHVGMFYVESWPWHAKSHYLSSTLESFMLIVEPWRMAVLWVIAGISIRFVMAKVSVWRFISMRSLRLLLPLLFGVLIVVPPQLYVEMTLNGDLQMSYWSFLSEFFSTNSNTFEKYQSGIWPHIDVNHLWFIRSLWQYSLVILCLLPLLNTSVIESGVNWLFRQHGVVAIVIAVMPIFLIQMFWELGESRYPLGFTLMIYGYLIGWNTTFWHRISQHSANLIVASLTCYILLIFFYNTVWIEAIKGNPVEYEWLLPIGMFNYSLLRILGVLTVFSLANRYLNKSSPKLRYFNEAVYPFYILHQSLIIVIGFNLSQLNLGPVIEPLLLISFTVISCILFFEIIRRTELLRPLFGLKMNKTYSLGFKKVGITTACLLVIPTALEILI